MAENPDAAGTKCRIFKDVISKHQARAATAGQTTPLYRIRRLLLDDKLEAIQQLDEFLNDIPGLNTEVPPPALIRIKEALVELDADDAGDKREITLLQWLTDDSLGNQHVRIVQDFAELCINSGHVFRGMTSVLKALLSSNIIRIHTFYNGQDDSIISLIIETREGGISYPISQAAKNEKYSRMHLKEVASCSDEEWQMVVDETSSDWRSALAEMLRIVSLTYLLYYFISLRFCSKHTVLTWGQQIVGFAKCGCVALFVPTVFFHFPSMWLGSKYHFILSQAGAFRFAVSWPLT
jgi:hypothetical protein